MEWQTPTLQVGGFRISGAVQRPVVQCRTEVGFVRDQTRQIRCASGCSGGAAGRLSRENYHLPRPGTRRPDAAGAESLYLCVGGRRDCRRLSGLAFIVQAFRLRKKVGKTSSPRTISARMPAQEKSCTGSRMMPVRLRQGAPFPRSAESCRQRHSACRRMAVCPVAEET